MRSKSLKSALLCATFCLISAGVFAMGGKDFPKNGKKNVGVTFDAMYELTKAVAKDKVNILPVIPAGMEPHDFEPKAKDLTFLSNADVLVCNGLGMEPWIEETLEAVNNKKLIKVDSSYGVEAIKIGEHHEEAEEHHDGHHHEEAENHHDADEHHHEDGENEHGHHHHHGGFDPHSWLGLSSAKIMVKNIAEGLSKADKANASFYMANAKAYISKINQLMKEYQDKFKTVKNDHFITSHAAFAYLCRDFGLEQKSVRGVFAEGEPSAKKIAELSEFVKEHKIRVVFAEEASPEISATLAKEANVKVEEIYTIEMPKDGKSYLERMESNLKKIYTSLK